jgi:hypothetical protein
MIRELRRLNPAVRIIAKPFTSAALLGAVAEALAGD